MKYMLDDGKPVKMMSFPSRERGLKLHNGWKHQIFITVVPFAGAWIESVMIRRAVAIPGVAPFAGAWIEIMIVRKCKINRMSLPSRERGLKSFEVPEPVGTRCRSLRGSVD